MDEAISASVTVISYRSCLFSQSLSHMLWHYYLDNLGTVYYITNFNIKKGQLSISQQQCPNASTASNHHSNKMPTIQSAAPSPRIFYPSDSSQATSQTFSHCITQQYTIAYYAVLLICHHTHRSDTAVRTTTCTAVVVQPGRTLET